MPTGFIVLLAALAGFAEVFPVSGSGHDAIASFLLDPYGDPMPSRATFEAVNLLGVFVALSVAMRRRLMVTLGEGIRAIARPVLFKTSPGAHDAAIVAVATATSFVVILAVDPWVRAFADVPLAVGIGLSVSALALASTWFAPKPHLEGPPLRLAILLGFVSGLSIVPGASRVGALLTLLIWLGVRPGRALELALLLVLPMLLSLAVDRWVTAVSLSHASFEAGAFAVAITVAFLAASGAVIAMRRLTDRGLLALFALWVLPLGLATIAYARALAATSASIAGVP